jgi:hypothetical protein
VAAAGSRWARATRGVLGLGPPGLGLGPAGLRRFLAGRPGLHAEERADDRPDNRRHRTDHGGHVRGRAESDTAMPNTIPSRANAATISPAPYLILAMSTLEAGFWTEACS